MAWVVMEGRAFMKFMERAKAGEDPELLMIEFYANADSEDVPGEGQ
jgi:hypothetical protein